MLTPVVTDIALFRQSVEHRAAHYREFQPAYVLARARTAAYQAALAGQGSGAGGEAADRLLDDPDRTFRLIMTEGALRCRCVPAEVLVQQLTHLMELSERPGVEVGVLPWSVRVPAAAGHAFHIYDNERVVVGVIGTLLTSDDPADVSRFIHVFEQLEQVAYFAAAGRRQLARIRKEIDVG